MGRNKNGSRHKSSGRRKYAKSCSPFGGVSMSIREGVGEGREGEGGGGVWCIQKLCDLLNLS